MKPRLLALVDPMLQSALAARLVGFGVRLWSSGVSRLPPEESLRRMLRLADELHERIDGVAIELDHGIHPKHRLTGYHDFFLQHVRAGDRVLDVGCGKGELAHDLATRGGASVTAIDISATSLDFARSSFAADRLEFLAGDVLSWNPSHPYDVVVLSNVLEHIAPRVALLERLHARSPSAAVLVRVPSRERDWLVPLREELGLPHFSDPTHETEYTVAQLAEELAEAGFAIEELEQRWGELWAVARHRDRRTPPLS